MNICARINLRASLNGIVIGSDLHQIVKPFSTFSFDDDNYYYYYEAVDNEYVTDFNKHSITDTRSIL
jgi:hypothetical protein